MIAKEANKLNNKGYLPLKYNFKMEESNMIEEIFVGTGQLGAAPALCSPNCYCTPGDAEDHEQDLVGEHYEAPAK
jgi:hypothetical protein